MFGTDRFKRLRLVMVAGVLLLAMGCAQQTVKTDEDVTAAGKGKGAGLRGKPGSETSMTEAERRRRRVKFRASLGDFETSLVHFDFDKSSIRADMRPILDKKAQFLLEFPTVQIQVEGHCDERGTVEYNIALGHRRAQSIKDYLVSKGVSPARIDTVSYGKERPLDPGHNEAAWWKNRRGKFNVVGGIPPGMN